MIHPDDRAKRQAAIDYAMDPVNHGQYKAEYRVIDSMDGTERTISVVGRIYFENGCANRLVGIAKDVTEHKNFQKKLRTQRNEIEEISKQQVAVRTASAIAHELNQPLAAISAYSEVIMHELQKDSINIENLKKMLGSCVKQAQRAGRSLHELIAFLQKGEQIAGPFDLNKIILEVLEIISNDGYERFSTNLNLEKHLPTVKCNTTQIQKVFFNLIRNALEAMQSIDSPILTITTKSHFLKGKNFAIVIVQDNGPGFDPLITKHIFEPFYTTKSSGIGMGLAISRALIETNGGMLWVESPLGNGTKFYFTLPLSQD